MTRNIEGYPVAVIELHRARKPDAIVEDDVLAPARGIVLGIAIGLGMYAVMATAWIAWTLAP